ncbi:hypothetical protein A0J57_03910 [Sphingobium sp. 22B]|nr:hypothetical protein A0J57_03910 [Sphingobium sp. 22B]OAP33478.1 hypothetical protein A8O16_03130 [Sphingobium sp. 20006FA]
MQQLNHLYAYHVDNFHIDEWVDLFTDDAFFDEREFGLGLHDGRAAIAEYGKKIVRETEYAVHLMATHIIHDVKDGVATGTAFALTQALMKNGMNARYQVKYEDVYRKVDGKWKIARRVLRKTFPVEVLTEPDAA